MRSREQKDRDNARRRERRASDPDYREQQNARRRDNWANNPELREKSKAQSTQWAKGNPGKRKEIVAKSRKKCGRGDPAKIKVHKQTDRDRHGPELARKQRGRHEKRLTVVAVLAQDRYHANPEPARQRARERYRRDPKEAYRLARKRKEELDEKFPGPNNGQPWSDEANADVMDRNLTTKQVAAKWGRTLGAVYAQRNILKRRGAA